MTKTEECKAIITVGDKKYETCHLRLKNMHVIDNSFHIDEGMLWFSFDTVDEYSEFYENIVSKFFNDAGHIISNIEFCFSDTHKLIPREGEKNDDGKWVKERGGVYLLQDNVAIRNNKIVLDISFHGQGRFYFKQED